MDIVLGVSMAPSNVGVVLLEGEDADGVTVDHDSFETGRGADSSPSRVLAAILGTRESAREGGYQLSSTGVTYASQAEAAVLRQALVDHKVENVMLVSAFLAAAALAQSVGTATRYEHTGLVFLEPEAATLAVVNTSDGAISEIRRQPLSTDDDRAVRELTSLVASADTLAARPEGLFVVGAGVNVEMIKPELEKVAPLPLSVPEEPELALARGAALASAHAPLFTSSTRAMAWAQDPGTGALDPAMISAGYAYVPPPPVDYERAGSGSGLAYSEVPDGPASGYLEPLGDVGDEHYGDDPELVDSRLLDFGTSASPVPAGLERLERLPGMDRLSGLTERRPLLVAGAVGSLFVAGVGALVVSLAVSMHSTTQHRPDIRANVVTHQAPPPKADVPPPPKPAPSPAPAPEAHPAPPPEAPAPAPEAPAPAPAPEAPPPAPAPVAPAPPPPPAAPPPPPPLPELQIPGLPGGPPLLGPPPRGPGWHDDDGWGGDKDWNRGHGPGRGRGRGHDNGQIPIPLPIPGLHLGLGF